jgi:dCMP deaminase
MSKIKRKTSRPRRAKRISKHYYYLNIAREVAKRGTCLRRNFGAVIVKEDQIISTGYNGAPRGTINCIDVGKCFREKLRIPEGTRYELCRAVHAEQNAIIHASRLDMIGTVMYLVGMNAESQDIIDPEICRLCKRMIINAGISKVLILTKNGKIQTKYVNKWKSNNLGEFRKVKNRFVPVMLKGY